MATPRHDKFTAITSPGAALSALQNNRNLGKDPDGYYWYAAIDTTFIKVFKTENLTATPTLEAAENLSNVVGIDTYSGLRSLVCRVLYTNSKWTVMVVVAFYDNLGAESVYALSYNSVDGWIDGRMEITIGGLGYKLWAIDAYVLDDADDQINILIFEELGTAAIYSSEYDITAFASNHLDLQALIPKADESIYGGSMYNGKYYFMAVDHLNAEKVYYVNDADGVITFVENLSGITNPAAWNLGIQHYQKFEKYDHVIDEEYYNYRKGSNAFLQVSDAGTTTNAPLWKHNDNNHYTIAYYGWKDVILKILNSGNIVKFQPHTDSAYVGWWDWVNNGVDTIYQLSQASFFAKSLLVTNEVERAPLASSITITKPPNEYYSFHRNTIPGLVTWGTASNPDLSIGTDNSGAGCTVTVIEKKDGERNILEFDDQNGAAACEFQIPFPETATGFVEFKVRSTNTGNYTYLYVADGSTSHVCYLRIRGDDFEDGNDATDIVAVADDIWYHVKINFNTTNWTVVVNGTGYGPYVVKGTPSLFDRIIWQTRASESGYQSYFKGLGFSASGYISGSGDNTHLFEGFRGVVPDKGGYKKTLYTSGILEDFKQTVAIAAVNATPHAWIQSIIDTYCSYMWYDVGIDDQYGALDFPAINGKSVAYCFRLVSLLKTHWFYYLPDSEVMWDDGTKYTGQNIVQGSDPIW